MQCLCYMDRRARYWLVREKHGNSLGQRTGGEWRGERQQHCEAVFFANLSHCLDDDQFARADGQNLAAEFPAHKDFENPANLDPVNRHADNNEIRKLSLQYLPQFVGPCTFTGDEAEIVKDVGEECSKVPFAVYNAGTR